jgi:hypothetical protein
MYLRQRIEWHFDSVPDRLLSPAGKVSQAAWEDASYKVQESALNTILMLARLQ